MDEAGKGEDAGDVLSRRAFVTGAVATATVAAAGGVLAQSPSVDEIPIIDAHIHLFDGARPLGGVYGLAGLSRRLEDCIAFHV